MSKPHNSAEHMTLTSTVIGGWSVAVGRALDAIGCDGDALLHEAGVDLEERFNCEARFNADHTRRLWQLALAETKQEDIGLQVARFVCPTTFHALGFSLWASNSLSEALKRMVRFEVLLNDGCHLHLDSEQGLLHFSMDVKQSEGKDLVAAEGVDYFLGAVVKMFRDMSAPSFAPIKATLTRARPDNPTCWDDFFNCPVEFSAQRNQLVFDRTTLHETLPTGNTSLAEQNDKLVEAYLHKMQLNDICGQVRSCLIELMPLGITTMDGVSQALSIPPRTLQYKLSQQGTTLQELRDNIREELARQYLQHSRQPFTQIAYSLGFSDPAHFNRAFKRWTGETPTAYRRRTSE
ncbi:AraC family transcriptional regulator [Neptuniibacter caesariensis]|uniref:Transcriptional regulator, AraC family protein n=1 Tax=Neptuniibacter caesariensis TaxID=207954 RepID=A0A7U8C8E1_NEPCE|nr:AraC family transcriptional regulator [Neptuniibacter caesariensis]EAR61970.1 transcriptional regulator, AraC family protein [Oceanospirillum sp. MED92] [Neptuniibacter caesariensis]